MDPSSAGNVFDNAFAALLTPLGMIAIVLAIIVAGAALVSRGCCWGLMALALWTSTFASAATLFSSASEARLWGPLQLIDENGRLLATGALLCVLLPSVFADRGWRVKLVTGASFAFLALEFVYCGRLLLAGLPTRAISSVGIYLMIFIIFYRGMGAWLHELGQAISLLRMVALAGVIFVGGNTLQMLINFSAASWNGRLFGTAGNPQHLAMDLATFLPAIMFLLLRKNEPKLLRICYAATLGLLIIMMIMTASRTGAIMLLVAIIVMFRRWLGKLLKVAVLGCIVAFLATMLFPDAAIETDRFTSTVDTRSGVWNALINDFLAQPVIGYLEDGPSIRESSYLSVAARLGIIGIIPMVTMIFLTFRAMRDLRQTRQFLGDEIMMVDAVSASMASLAVGGLTEGFLLGTLTLQVYLIYINLALMVFLIDYVAQDPTSHTPEEGDYPPVQGEVFYGAYDF